MKCVKHPTIKNFVALGQSMREGCSTERILPAYMQMVTYLALQINKEIKEKLRRGSCC